MAARSEAEVTSLLVYKSPAWKGGVLYYSLAEERTNKSKWLADFNYLYLLRDAGCFDPRTAPQPEQFAELMASVEEKIRLHASGVAK